MLTYLKYGLVVLCVALTLFACSDHRLGGALSPARLRLKSFTSGSNTTMYTYDNQNKVSTIARPDGSLGVFLYDDPSKKSIYFYEYPNPADKSKGTVTVYPTDLQPLTLPPGTYLIVGKRYGTVGLAFINQVNLTPDKLFSYYFDANKRLASYSTSDGNNTGTSVQQTVPMFTNENITQSDYSAKGAGLTTTTLAYDDKTNPFFGLMDPSIDVIERYSRNNRVKTSVPSYNELREYTYEYNAQGLPTKRTLTTGGVEVTMFTYEAY